MSGADKDARVRPRRVKSRRKAHDEQRLRRIQPKRTQAVHTLLGISTKNLLQRIHLELLDREHHDTSSPCCRGLLHD